MTGIRSKSRRAYGLRDDEKPWIPIAQQIISGTYPLMDSSTRESIRIGLRLIEHPDAKKALAILATPRKGKAR